MRAKSKSEIYILGNGAMAKALALALKDDYELYVVARNTSNLSFFKQNNIKTMFYDEFDMSGKTVILAFKPYVLKLMKDSLQARARIVISVLAGVSLDELSVLNADNIVRIMPNIAAKYKASTTTFIRQNELYKDEILELIQSFGDAFELEKEELFDAAMVISGCAPAFLSIIAESMANAALCEGLTNKLSYDLVKSLFKGYHNLLSNEHPALIKEQICSPAGVTIKGVKALEEEGVRAAFFKAFAASLGK